MPRSEMIRFPWWSVWREAWEGLEKVGRINFCSFFFTLNVALCGPHFIWVSSDIVSWSQPTLSPKQAVKVTSSQVPLDLEVLLAWSWPWLSAGLSGFLFSIGVWPLRIPHFHAFMFVCKNMLFIFYLAFYLAKTIVFGKKVSLVL